MVKCNKSKCEWCGKDYGCKIKDRDWLDRRQIPIYCVEGIVGYAIMREMIEENLKRDWD